MKATVIGSSICLGLLFVAAAEGQLKDTFKKLGQQIKDAATKGTNSAKPADSGGSQSAPSPPGTGGAQAAQGKTPSDQPSDQDILPDLAVDEAVVASQQQQFRKRCEDERWPQKGVNCDCAVEQYPNARLVVLSQLIRGAEVQKEMHCRDVSAPGCRVTLEQYNRYTSPEFQKTYEPERSTVGFEVTRRPACRDNTMIAQQEERNCLQRANGGMLSLPPGKSTTGYCSCVKQEVEKFQSAAQAMVACQSR